ncbi:hypothetical protein F5Y05DRAFT_423431 [Hypoxylon sp. FL0543]|nr:hypothetical protein F5Y05DRAFT_423431 [Hypoxylon sp. FL0543]
MPKNKGKGGKTRRRGKKETGDKRELLFKEVSQEYAYIDKTLGNGRFKAITLKTNDSDKCQVHLSVVRGSMRKKKKVFVRRGDFVLLALREFEDGKADIIHLYTQAEVHKLIEYGELPKNALAHQLDGEAYAADDGYHDIFEVDMGDGESEADDSNEDIVASVDISSI